MPTVREYGQTQIRCDHDDVEFLLRMVRGGTSESVDARVLQSLTPTTTPDLYTLTAGPYVGRLALPSGTTLDFLPRFSFLDTLEVIRVAHRLPARIEDRGVDADEGRFLIDMLAQAYSREMTRIAARGLLKNYTDMRHHRPPYPGRLDAAEHLRLFAGRPDRLITRSHRLSVNVPENQLLARRLGCPSADPS